MDFETDFETDYEHYRTIHPNGNVSGCYFHLCKNIWRKVQGLGLQQRYQDDAEFSMHIRMIMALAFIPLVDINRAFDDLSTEIRTNFNNNLDDLLDYFEDTYIGRLRRNGQRGDPTFAQVIWNMHTRARNELPRTNNNVEGWHRGIQFHINACHPNIWKFLDVIKREENLTRVKITQCLGGHPNVPQKKKYLDCNVRITNIVQNYAALPTLDYLRRIAHNLLQ